MSNNSNNINIFNNTIFLPIPLPPFMNTFNNFGSIQYKGKAVPRINLESNNFQKNFFPTENDSNTSNQISENLNDDIEILIESNDKDYFFTPESKDKTHIKAKKNFKNFSKNNNKNFEQNINELFSKTINNVIIPPKSFISIIEDKDEEIENNDYNNNKYNVYENINSIVINNLDKLLNDSHCFIIDNNYIMPNKTDIIENPNFLQFVNYTHFNINHLNGKKTPQTTPLLLTKKRKEKNLFTVSSSNNKEITKNQSKRGRKLKKENGNRYRRVHGASDYDNILRKIQVHYLNFIINYVNDVVKVLIDDKKVPTFKSLDYKIKKIVNFQYFEDMKSKPISEILQLKISPKIKVYDKEENKNIFKQICSICPFFSEFCKQNYLSLFKEYYGKEKFEVKGMEIKLSMRTKTFSDLIRKNYNYKERLQFVAQNYFINNSRKPTFKTNAQLNKK
jgi:hypothetical protein